MLGLLVQVNLIIINYLEVTILLLDAEVPTELQAGEGKWEEESGALEMGWCTAAKSMLNSAQVLLLPTLLTPYLYFLAALGISIPAIDSVSLRSPPG